MTIPDRLLKVLSEAVRQNLTLEQAQEANFVEDFGLSSIDSLEILIHIEGEFGVQIADEDLSIELVSSFQTLLDYIQTRLPATA